MRVRAIVAAPSKAASGSAGGLGWAERALMMFDIARRAECAVRADRQHSRCPAVIIRDERPFAGLMQAQVARTCPFRRDCVDQLQPPAGMFDLVGAYRTAVRTLVRLSFVRRIQTSACTVDCQTRWVRPIFKDRSLDKYTGGRVHFEQIDALATSRSASAPSRELYVPTYARIG